MLKNLKNPDTLNIAVIILKFEHCGYIMLSRNKFHFSEVHRSMIATGNMQSMGHPKGVTSTLHGTHCVHTSMNLRNMKYIPYIYTCFYSLFVEFLFKSCK